MNRREFLVGAAAVASPVALPAWTVVAPGLDWLEGAGPANDIGDGKVRVLRIDPKHWALRLLCSGSMDSARTARQWCTQEGLTAAINAAMFRPDGSGTGLMRNGTNVSNGTLSADRSLLVFDPKDTTLPPAALLDRDCDDFASADHWGSAVQSIRMVACKRKNVWTAQPRRWSTAAIGADGAGRILFLHARSPWSGHHFADLALGLPIDLERMMHVEGGPEAQIYLTHGEFERELVGSYETGFFESDGNDRAWPIPNVVGLVAR